MYVFRGYLHLLDETENNKKMQNKMFMTIHKVTFMYITVTLYYSWHMEGLNIYMLQLNYYQNKYKILVNHPRTIPFEHTVRLAYHLISFLCTQENELNVFCVCNL